MASNQTRFSHEAARAATFASSICWASHWAWPSWKRRARPRSRYSGPYQWPRGQSARSTMQLSRFPGVSRQREVLGVQGRVAPPGAIVEVHVEVGLGQVHELEHVLDAVLPVPHALVAGPVRPERRHGPPELLQRQADPARGVIHLVEQGQPDDGHARDVDPQVVLQVRAVPPGLAAGRRLEHRRGAFDQRLANLRLAGSSRSR